MRWWKAFQTQAERRAWERQEKEANPDMRVCARMTARRLEKECGMPAGYTGGRYATVYTYTRWKD